MYFVGAGSDSNDDAAAARQQAAGDLVSSITRFLGVKVSSSTTVEARDSLNEFTSSLSQTIQEESEARLGDFRVVDSFTERRGNVVNVYLLGEYDKSSLLSEKSRLEALFQERQEAISGPELRGDQLLAERSYYEAAVQYLNAAAAAASGDVDNAKVKYERNMKKAREAIGEIKLSKLNDNLRTNLREDFAEPFRMKIESRSDSLSLAGVPVRAVYKTVRDRDTGRTVVATASLSSDERGVVEFFRPVPQMVGPETVSMELDLSSALEPLEDVPNEMYPELEAVEGLVRDKRVQFNYTVVSRAREVPTAVMIADLDNGGTFLNKTETASGLLESLSSHDFSISSIPVDMDLLRGPESELYERIRARYGERYRRLVYGTVAISDFREDASRYMVKVSGDVKVVDLESQEVLYSSGSLFKSALGQNIQSAMSAAFKQFGKTLGDALSRSLP